MTNEELAVLAASGDRESQHKLYFAVAPLIYKLTSRYFKYCEGNRRGVRPEDLIQCGYFAYLEAVKAFSPEKELKFTTYLQFCVQNTCRSELGFCGKKEVETISLETPVAGEDEGLTLGDTIADPNAEADIGEYAELNEMQLIVRREVDRLPEPQQFVIYGLFWDGKTLEQIAEEHKWREGAVHRRKAEAYFTLYNSEVMQLLAAAHEWGDPWKKAKHKYFDKSRKNGHIPIVTWNQGGIVYLDKETVDGLFRDSELTPIGGLTLWD